MVDQEGREGAQEQAEQSHWVNFFKPTSEHGRSNVRLVGSLVAIWAVAVFGFQFLLIGLQKPTGEPAYRAFEAVWPAVSAGTASPAQQKEFGRVALAVLGKNVALKADHREAVKRALNGTLVQLGGPAATGSVEAAASALALGNEGFDPLYRELLTTSLIPETQAGVTADAAEIPAIMELYLVHNRSALTDFRFLGFPFHYWYTGQFLLILFVVLCLVYAVVIEKIHKKHGFVEE